MTKEYKKIPLPMEGWMIRRGWNEESVVYKLNFGCLYVARDTYGKKVYREPGVERYPDLWTNPGKGLDAFKRDQYREECREKVKRGEMPDQVANIDWLGTIGLAVEGIMEIFQILLLPFTIMGMRDATQWWMGTGKYGGGGGGEDAPDWL